MADTSRRGFASMDPEKKRMIASKGGKAAHQKGTAHEFTPDEARAAGRKGGERVSQNREHMASIGRKGGEAVSRDREHMAAIGRKGGEAVSRDRAHMANIGREGGEARGKGENEMPRQEQPGESRSDARAESRSEARGESRGESRSESREARESIPGEVLSQAESMPVPGEPSQAFQR